MQRIAKTQDDGYDKSQLFTVAPYKDGNGYYNLDLSTIKNKKEFIIRSLMVLAGTVNNEIYQSYREGGDPSKPIAGIAKAGSNTAQILGGGEIEQFILGGQEQEFFTQIKGDRRVFENRIVGCLFTALFLSQCFAKEKYQNKTEYRMPYNYDKNKSELSCIGMETVVDEQIQYDPINGEQPINNFTPTGGSGLDYQNIYEHYYNLALSFYKTIGDAQMVNILKIIDEARVERKVKDIKETIGKKSVSFETINKKDVSFKVAKLEDRQNPSSIEKHLVELFVDGIGILPVERLVQFNDNIIEYKDENGNDIFKFRKSGLMMTKTANGFVMSSNALPLMGEGERVNVDSQDCIQWKDGSLACVSGEHTGQYCIFTKAPEVKLKPEDTYVKQLKYCTIGVVDEEGNTIQMEGFLKNGSSCFNFNGKGPFEKIVTMRVNGKEISLKDDKEKCLKYYKKFISALHNGISVKTDKELAEMLQNASALQINERFILAKLAVLNKQNAIEKEDDFIKEKKKKEKEEQRKEERIKKLEEQKKKRLQNIASGKSQEQAEQVNNEIRTRKGLALQAECNAAIDEIRRNIARAPQLQSIDDVEISLLDKILDVFRAAFGFKTKKQKLEEQIRSKNAYAKQMWDNYIKTCLTRKASAASVIRQAMESGQINIPDLSKINDILKSLNLDTIQEPVSNIGTEAQMNLNSGRRRGRRK